MRFQKCKCCNGTGKQFDQTSVGGEMRTLRTKAGLSVRRMAAILKLSPPYVSDLELGRRNWREDLIRRYKEACQ